MVDIKKLESEGSNGLADAADDGRKSTLPFEQMGMSFSHGAPDGRSAIEARMCCRPKLMAPTPMTAVRCK